MACFFGSIVHALVGGVSTSLVEVGGVWRQVVEANCMQDWGCIVEGCLSSARILLCKLKEATYSVQSKWYYKCMKP